jgi:hypothetical protein
MGDMKDDYMSNYHDGLSRARKNKVSKPKTGEVRE